MAGPVAETNAAPSMPLDVSGLTISLKSGPLRIDVIEDVHLRVRPGEILGLVGESGSGKSVTCLAALGLLGPAWKSDGEIRLARTRITDKMSDSQLTAVRGREAAMIFQDASASLNPIQRVGKQLTETVARLQKVPRARARKIALDLLRRVEMPDPEERFHSYPFQLSGGQNQRVMIAVALAGRPELLFADEPTTALDVTVQSQILALIKSLRDETEMGVVFVTHDLGVVKEVCDTVAVMYAGRIVETGSVDRIMSAPRHPYTMGLISSMPTLSGHIPDGIEGQVPSPDRRPPGCAFAPRCERAQEKCRHQLPVGVPGEQGDTVACFFPLTGEFSRDETAGHAAGGGPRGGGARAGAPPGGGGPPGPPPGAPTPPHAVAPPRVFYPPPPPPRGGGGRPRGGPPPRRWQTLSWRWTTPHATIRHVVESSGPCPASRSRLRKAAAWP
ncbi:MAG: ABC transporter ATP-binding protein [Paracoccaceae bacterium]|nr:ABC transporter ATP-binding protein [Paracoccaceae bacterium]